MFFIGSFYFMSYFTLYIIHNVSHVLEFKETLVDDSGRCSLVAAGILQVWVFSY